MKAILLVTWLVAGQPPTSYHVEFDSTAKCEAARQAVLDERDRAYNVGKYSRPGIPDLSGLGNNPTPKVTAVCVRQ